MSNYKKNCEMNKNTEPHNVTVINILKRHYNPRRVNIFIKVVFRKL